MDLSCRQLKRVAKSGSLCTLGRVLGSSRFITPSPDRHKARRAVRLKGRYYSVTHALNLLVRVGVAFVSITFCSLSSSAFNGLTRVCLSLGT